MLTTGRMMAMIKALQPCDVVTEVEGSFNCGGAVPEEPVYEEDTSSVLYNDYIVKLTVRSEGIGTGFCPRLTVCSGGRYTGYSYTQDLQTGFYSDEASTVPTVRFNCYYNASEAYQAGSFSVVIGKSLGELSVGDEFPVRAYPVRNRQSEPGIGIAGKVIVTEVTTQQGSSYTTVKWNVLLDIYSEGAWEALLAYEEALEQAGAKLTLTTTNLKGEETSSEVDMSCLDEKFVHIEEAETINGVKTFNAGYFGNVAEVTGGEIDVSLATAYTLTLAANAALTFTGAPANRSSCFTLKLNNGGNYTVTWPASVHWHENTVPSLTQNGTDILTFITFDGGLNWYGALTMTGVTQ